MVIVALLYFTFMGLTSLWPNRGFSLGLGTFFLLAYALFILRVERREFRRLPVIGKFLGGGAVAGA
jgi:hypothetical protein